MTHDTREKKQNGTSEKLFEMSAQRQCVNETNTQILFTFSVSFGWNSSREMNFQFNKPAKMSALNASVWKLKTNTSKWKLPNSGLFEIF